MLDDAEQRRGWSFSKGSLLLVFALQPPLQMVVSAPVQLGQSPGDAPLTALSAAGAALAAFGVVFEALADWQLAAFKADPQNGGAVMDKGLWRYTRHPNYFGEACVWWGLFLLACPASLGIWSLPGPVLLTLLLTKGSGVPTVEKRMKERGDAYAEYVRRTSGFIPWFPKPARR
jgi:steroid 5-alpha reductase family enzyme